MNYSKDIKLESNSASYYFRYLEWDSDFFNKRSYCLDIENSILNPCAKIKESFEKCFNNSFVTIKVDTLCPKELLYFLQILGFRYIDTEICLKYNYNINIPATYNNQDKIDVDIKKVDKNKNIPCEELGSVYHLTRFHYDINIAKEKADLLWISYIKNYKPSPLNHFFIANHDDNTIGAILVNESDNKINDKNQAFIFFVSVLKPFRGKNIGSKLIQHTVNYFKTSEIATGTQAKNIKAMNFYIKNGFSIVKSTKTVLHRWS